MLLISATFVMLRSKNPATEELAMLLELCVATALQAGVTITKGTVGIVGFRQSSFNYSVLAIHPGSPAEGVLQVGDKVLAIDGDANRHNATGVPGTSVVL